MKSMRAFSVVASLALALALPAGTAFALQSPTLQSPTLQSPTLQSPTLESPTLDSPTLGSPALDANQGATSLDSAAASQIVSNAAANTIATTAVSKLASASTETGVIMSPASGAPNLSLIAAVTSLAFAGAVAGSIALFKALRKVR